MEDWVKSLANKLGGKIFWDHGHSTKYATLLADDQDTWWSYAMEDLLKYVKTKTHAIGGLIEVVFRLGDFRVNIYTDKSGWQNCKYVPIETQKNEMENMAEAIYQTWMVRFKEHKELEGARIDDWVKDQLVKRGLRYEYPSWIR